MPTNPDHTLDRLDAIQHEFRIYETETCVLHAFVDRVREIGITG